MLGTFWLVVYYGTIVIYVKLVELNVRLMEAAKVEGERTKHRD